MITRDQLLDSIVHECNVCKHLHSKFTPEGFEYRPTSDQRSALELMQYLSICAVAGLKVMMEGTWEAWRPYGERARGMSGAEFPAAMDRQIEEFRELLNAIPESDFTEKEVAHPSGAMMPLGMGLIRMPFAWLTAYRMQLFLYAKAAGASHLNTANCWSGIDWKGPAAEVAEQEEATA